MISDFIKPESVVFELDGTDRDEILAELTEKLISLNSNLKREEIFDSLVKREEKMSTLVSAGFAVPHAVSSSVSETVIALGVSHKGIEFNMTETDKEASTAKIVFCLVFPENKPDEHLELLKDILLIAKNPDFMNSVLSAKDAVDICEILKKEGSY